MNRKIFLFTWLLLCLVAFAVAQKTNVESTDTLKPISLQEIIITGNRINIPLKLNPAATSIVTGKELQMMPRSIAADEALRLVPGVTD